VKSSTYRLVYAGLGLALVAVVVLAVAFAPSGTPTALPAPLVSVFPKPGDSVIRQTSVDVDVAATYTVVLFVDGARIPEAEMTVLPGAGRYSWRPGPGRIIETWSAGIHDVTVTWASTGNVPDTGEFSWTFRVQ
jgi:hypothetical protein